MATQLKLLNTTLNGITDTGDGILYDMTTSFGASADTGVVNTVASGTEIQWTKTAGGSSIAWISGRVPAGGFTLTTTDVDLWAQESNGQANCGGRFRVFKRTAAGVLTEVAGGPFNDGVEFGTAAASMTWVGNVTDTAFAENDRILVRFYITNVGTMGANRTCTMTFNAASGTTGDSFFNIAETVAFKAEELTVSDANIPTGNTLNVPTLAYAVTAAFIAAGAALFAPTVSEPVDQSLTLPTIASTAVLNGPQTVSHWLTVQDWSIVGAGVGSISRTFDTTPTEGNLLVAVGYSQSGTGDTIEDASMPSGWQLAVSADAGITIHPIGIWWKIAGASEPTTVTLTWTDSTLTKLSIAEFSGNHASSPVDQVAFSDGVGGETSHSSGTTPTTSADDGLGIAAFGWGNSAVSPSYTNGFTEEVSQGSTQIAVLSKWALPVGTYETTASWTTSRGCGGVITVFKVAANDGQSLSLPTIASGAVLNVPTPAYEINLPTQASSTTLTPPSIALNVETPNISSGAALFAPTVTQGQSVTTPTIASAVQLNAPTVTYAVTTPQIASGNVLFAPSVAQNLTAANIPAGSSLNAPTVAYVLQPPTIASGVALNAPSTAYAVQPPTIASGAQLNAPTVAYAVQVPTIVSGAVLNAPTLTVAGTIAPPTIASGVALNAPTLTTTSSVTTPTITSGSALFAPSVAYGVQAPTIASGVVLRAPTVAQVSLLPAIPSGATLNAPSLALNITTPTIASTVSLFPANLAAVVEPPVIDSTTVITPPSPAYEANAALISSGVALNAPSVLVAFNQTIEPPTIPAGSEVFAPSAEIFVPGIGILSMTVSHEVQIVMLVEPMPRIEIGVRAMPIIVQQEE